MVTGLGRWCPPIPYSERRELIGICAEMTVVFRVSLASLAVEEAVGVPGPTSGPVWVLFSTGDRRDRL